MPQRCSWVDEKSPLYVKYHDKEWGVPVYDDKKLFEILVLEGFQAGLSWLTILKKRENFKSAFDNFNVEKVAKYDEAKVAELFRDEKIIRNRLKIKSAITNAKIFIKIQKEFGAFSDYIWSFTGGKVIKFETFQTTSPLSDAVSKDLKGRGMKFVGSVIIYSYLQAIGIINDHEKDCFLY